MNQDGEWPIVEDRLLCTSARPMPADALKGSRWIHPEAESADSYSDYYQAFKCLACGHKWSVELPE